MSVKQSRADLRRRLSRIAAAQSGYFTAAQALDAGYSYSAQRYHVHRANWEQVDRALFRLPEWPIDSEDEYVRWFLWSKERGVVSHDTALSIYGLSEVNPAKIHLTVPRSFRMDAPGVVLHVAELREDEILDRRGYRITTPLRTVVDAAAGTLELDQVAKAIADGEREGRFTRRMLRQAADDVGATAALRVERALDILDSEAIG